VIGQLALTVAPRFLTVGSIGAADVSVRFISILSTVLVVAIIIRAILSWFTPDSGTGLLRIIMDVTEPILGPIRRILPPVGGIDFSPFLAIILIWLVGQLLIHALSPVG
jgi:YggT family protein